MKIKGIILLISIFLAFSVLAQEVKTRRYLGIVEVGGGMSVGDYKGGYLLADMVFAYKFNDNISLGPGVGIRRYWSDEAIVPIVYANFRANLGYDKYEKFYPYIQTGLGFPVFKQSIGIAFKNNPVTVELCGEVVPLIGSTLFTTFGLNIGITF